MIGLILAASIILAPYGSGSFGKGSYVNTAGHVVKRPVLSDEKPVGATGRCTDRYWTFSEQRNGACQGHGGVAVWINLDGGVSK